MSGERQSLAGTAALKYLNSLTGWVVEWFKAPVLKTGVAKVTVGSNPTPSARTIIRSRSSLFADGQKSLMK